MSTRIERHKTGVMNEDVPAFMLFRNEGERKNFRLNIKQARALANNGFIFEELVERMLCPKCEGGKYKLSDEPDIKVIMNKNGQAIETETEGTKRKELNRLGIEERFGVWKKIHESLIEQIDNDD